MGSHQFAPARAIRQPSAIPAARHAPDHVPHVVRDEQRSARIDDDTHGTAARVAVVVDESGEHVARFAGAGEPEKVNRTVYQAFLAATVLALAVIAPAGYLLAPSLLGLVHATDLVRAEALPFLRIMFVCSAGMMLFFMISGALRAAGDARTPLRLGAVLTLLNIGLNVVFIRGLGPIPRFGTAGAARSLDIG